MRASMPHDPLMPRWLPAVNRRVVNPVQRFWAPWLPPLALVLHTGRRSGRAYRTPVLAFRSGSALAIVLFYGTRTDWLRNLRAGGGTVIRAGRRHAIRDLRLAVPGDRLPRGVRLAARRIPVLLVELD